MIYHLNSLIIEGDFFQTSNTVRKKRCKKVYSEPKNSDPQELQKGLNSLRYKNFRF